MKTWFVGKDLLVFHWLFFLPFLSPSLLSWWASMQWDVRCFIRILSRSLTMYMYVKLIWCFVAIKLSVSACHRPWRGGCIKVPPIVTALARAYNYVLLPRLGVTTSVTDSQLVTAHEEKTLLLFLSFFLHIYIYINLPSHLVPKVLYWIELMVEAIGVQRIIVMFQKWVLRWFGFCPAGSRDQKLERTLDIKDWTYPGRLRWLSNAHKYEGTQSITRKYPPHHYSTSLTQGRMDPCSHVVSDPTVWMSQLKSTFIRPANVFPFFWACANCSLSFLFLSVRSGLLPL